jgi:hypothetical protein
VAVLVSYHRSERPGFGGMTGRKRAPARKELPVGVVIPQATAISRRPGALACRLQDLDYNQAVGHGLETEQSGSARTFISLPPPDEIEGSRDAQVSSCVAELPNPTAESETRPGRGVREFLAYRSVNGN